MSKKSETVRVYLAVAEAAWNNQLYLGLVLPLYDLEVLERRAVSGYVTTL